MTRRTIEVLGMELEEWVHESCVATFGVGDDWATLYDIRSGDPGKGHATELLRAARQDFELAGKRFAGSVALNDRMRSIYRRLEITELQGSEN